MKICLHDDQLELTTSGFFPLCCTDAASSPETLTFDNHTCKTLHMDQGVSCVTNDRGIILPFLLTKMIGC
jgi:hypothetical protein